MRKVEYKRVLTHRHFNIDNFIILLFLKSFNRFPFQTISFNKKNLTCNLQNLNIKNGRSDAYSRKYKIMENIKVS